MNIEDAINVPRLNYARTPIHFVYHAARTVREAHFAILWFCNHQLGVAMKGHDMCQKCEHNSMCKYKYGFQSSFLNQNVPSEEWQMLPAQIEGMNIG